MVVVVLQVQVEDATDRLAPVQLIPNTITSTEAAASGGSSRGGSNDIHMFNKTLDTMASQCARA